QHRSKIRKGKREERKLDTTILLKSHAAQLANHVCGCIDGASVTGNFPIHLCRDALALKL
ncbi:hypothetical protein CDAR_105691, partial [Caerostris darwini]